MTKLMTFKVAEEQQAKKNVKLGVPMLFDISLSNDGKSQNPTKPDDCLKPN